MRRLTLLLAFVALLLIAARTDNTGAPTTGAVGESDCVDGCAFTGDTSVENLAVEGSMDFGTYEQLAISATPSVLGGALFETAIGHGAATHITNFADGVHGQWIVVRDHSTDPITFTCGNNLQCGTEDIVTANGDTTVWLFSGILWDLMNYNDFNIDNNPSAYLPLAGGTMTGHTLHGNDIGSRYGAGNLATITHDGSNFLIDNGTGYTDITGAIFVAEDEDVYSRIGGAPSHLSPTDAIDMLVIRKERTVNTGVKRAFASILDLNYSTSTASRQNYGFNAFVYTGETDDGGNNRTNGSGGATAGRYGFRHLGAGTFATAGGVSSSVEITDDAASAEDGTITTAYAFLDEGGDGGTGTGKIAEYFGLWIRDAVSGSNVDGKTGVYIEDLMTGTTSIGIQIDGADTYALWLGAGGSFTDAPNGITFGLGADVNVYRCGNDLLCTDDALVVSQGISVDAETVTATSATLGVDDYVILVDDDTAGSTVTITLPAAASHAGRVYHIKKLGTTANVVIDGNASETIDGATTHTLSIQYDSRQIVCDGSNWSII